MTKSEGTIPPLQILRGDFFPSPPVIYAHGALITAQAIKEQTFLLKFYQFLSNYSKGVP